MKHHIFHDTIFSYDNPVRESIMEVRLQPRDDERQRCQHFNLSVTPRTMIYSFDDALDNAVHHFNITVPVTSLLVRAESMVEVLPCQPLPSHLSSDSWKALDSLQNDPLLDMLLPSQFAQPTALLTEFMHRHQIERGHDPLSTVNHISTLLFDTITYTPQSTSVDSPIDVVLTQQKGVCQDITHVMIAICRTLGIPSRYISGYLYHRRDDHDRSQSDATHAWLEVWLPDLGWIGIDPTNRIWAGERHIRIAIGRDYADVPPTRGVYRGQAIEHLDVVVSVNDANIHTQAPPPKRPSWPSTPSIAQQIQQQQ
ncbi:MAG: transglutaminase family protein [Roseiflexaceae bacterium]